MHLLESLLGHGDADLHQVPDDLIHVLAMEAHLGVLSGLHLDEGRLGQLGDAASDLSLQHRAWGER